MLSHAAKSLQSCLTLSDPIDGSPSGSPSLGFSRQEHWSGLPFPSPMHESEVTQSCPTLSDPMDCSLSGSSVHGFSRQEYWSGVPLPSPYFTIYLYNSICFCVNWRYQYVTVTNQCLFSFEVKIYILQNVQTLSTNLPSFHKCIYMCNSNLYQHKDHYNHHRKFLYPPGPHSSDFSHRDYLCLF